MAQNIVQNAFRVVEGRAVTSSFKVAEYFGQAHRGCHLSRRADPAEGLHRQGALHGGTTVSRLHVALPAPRKPRALCGLPPKRRFAIRCIHVGSRSRLQLAEP